MGRGSYWHADDLASADDAAHVLIFNPWITLLGQSAYAAITGLIYYLYRPLVPADRMQIWLTAALLIGGFVLLLNIAFAVRRPKRHELLHFWRPIDKRVPLLFDVIAAMSIWLLFPHGSTDLQMVSIAFCVGYVPLQMISDPENTLGNRLSIFIVLGSYAAYLLSHGGQTQQILAVLFALYGIVLFIAADAFRDVVVSAVAARLESERSAEALRIAVAQVAAERDAKTRFMASASHDLGQPLQAANLFAEHLMAADNDVERAQAKNGLQRAIASAQALLGDLLSHLRLESDTVVPNNCMVQIGPTLQKLVEQFAPVAKSRQITLRSVSTNRYIWGDPALLDRALGNLVSNAIVHSQGKRILVGTRKAGQNKLVIWIIDDGQGIAEADRPFIFDDYFQSSSTKSNARGGVGLGLPSVRRIAALLRGNAGVDPRWVHGSAFYLTLPSSESATVI
jgi:signal transduction histidine kinase